MTTNRTIFENMDWETLKNMKKDEFDENHYIDRAFTFERTSRFQLPKKLMETAHYY